MSKEDLKAALLQQANEKFPAAARAGGYPIRFNHCFLRVVYDNLFGAKWQTVLINGKPAIHQLTEAQLIRALETGREVIEYPAVCRELNDQSLAWRAAQNPSALLINTQLYISTNVSTKLS